MPKTYYRVSFEHPDGMSDWDVQFRAATRWKQRLTDPSETADDLTVTRIELVDGVCCGCGKSEEPK